MTSIAVSNTKIDNIKIKSHEKSNIDDVFTISSPSELSNTSSYDHIKPFDNNSIRDLISTSDITNNINNIDEENIDNKKINIKISPNIKFNLDINIDENINIQIN